MLEAVYQSLPFGDGYAANTADDPTENHFTGKDRDVESGNDYFLARYYGSSTGRFLSPDPSGLYYADPGDPKSLNLYEYVMNNPLTMIDPDGLRQVCGKQTSSTDANGVYTVHANCYDVPDPNINEIVNTTLLRMDWDDERIGMQFAKKIKSPPPNTAARTARRSATPWYQNPCVQSALAKGAATTSLDSVGLLPDGGAVSAAFSLWQGAAGVSNGTKMLQNVKMGAVLISTASSGSDSNWFGGVTGAASIAASLGKAAPVYGQILSGISLAGDVYSTYKAVAGCQP